MTTLSQAVRRTILTEQLRADHARHDGFPPTLPPPIIPDVLVHNGLNKHDLHDPTVPVLVQVIVQLDWGVGDRLDLYWNDVAVGTQAISADDRELTQTNFRVLPADIPEGVTRVHYHHIGLVGSGERASIEHAPFLVKRTVPGNPDPNPNTPYINENLSPLTGIPESLPATGGPLTVGIARYENIAADDVITVYWSGVPVTRTVSQEEATGSGALSVVISAEIIRNNPGLNLAITYDIRDTVKNWSLFSETQRTDVESAGALHVPTVRDADDFDVLDVDELAGGDVAIQIPVNGNMDVPSTGTLTWTGQPVLGPRLTYTLPFSITQASTRLTLWVPHIQAAALVGSTATVYYDGVRNGTPGRSARASVSLVGQPVELAKPTLAGVSGDTYNPDLITGTHQEVLVPAYSFMAVGQSVTLIWEGTTASGGSVYQTQTVPIQQPAQVGRPVSFLIEKIYATTLAGGSLRVSYTVVAQDQEYRSQVLELNVSGQVNTLPAPETIPVFADGNVDPGQVGTTLQVVVKANGVLLPGDQVTVHWHGNPDASTNPSSSFPATGDLSVIIAKDPFVLGNAGGLVEVWYDVRRNGVPFGSSRVLNLNIGDAGAQPWPVPVVTDATGSVANPLSPIRPGTSNTENTATVVLSDSRLALGDVVAAVWRYPDGTNPSIPYGLVTTAGQVQMAVPREVLAASVGKTIEVVCVVFRANVPVGTSQTLNLGVSSIPQNALPTPAITQAQGTELDVSRLTADATATVAAWPLIATTQFYWLEARGTLANNSPTVIPVASNVQVSNLNGVSQPITLARLQALKDGSTLTLEMKVAFGGNANETVTFAASTYTVHTVADTRPVITNVRDSKGNVADGGTTADTTVTLSGTATANQQIDIYDGSIRRTTATVNASGAWSVGVTGLASGSHVFTARALYGGGLESSSWVVIVALALTIDTSTMVLNGLYNKNRRPTNRTRLYWQYRCSDPTRGYAPLFLSVCPPNDSDGRQHWKSCRHGQWFRSHQGDRQPVG